MSVAALVVYAIACLLPIGAAQAQDQALRVLVPAGLDAVVPAYTAGNFNLGLMRNVFETLTIVTADDKLQGLLATSWEPSSDGKSWIFHLRYGVTFTDGTPFNADAVMKSFEYVLNTKKVVPARGNLGTIDGVRVINDDTVEIQSSAPFSGLPIWVSHPVAAIVSPKSYAQFGADAGAHISSGTGPFMIGSFDLPDRLVLRRNPNYWGTKAKMEAVDIRFINDDQTRLAAILSGEADVDFYVDPQDVQRFEGDSDFSVISAPSIRAYIIHLPMNLPEMKDRRVREASNLAIDRKTIIDQVFAGQAEPLDSAIGPHEVGYKPVAEIPYDPKKAGSLLAEAGWSKNARAKLVEDATADVFHDYPALFLVAPSYVIATRSDIKGVYLSPVEFHGFVNAYRVPAK